MDGVPLLPTRLVTDAASARAAGEAVGQLLMKVGGGDLSWLRLPRAVATTGSRMARRLGEVELAVCLRVEPDGYAVEVTLSADQTPESLPVHDLLDEARRLAAAAELAHEPRRTVLRLRTSAAPAGVAERLLAAGTTGRATGPASGTAAGTDAAPGPVRPSGWSTTDRDPTADLVRSLERRAHAAERRVAELEAAEALGRSRTDFLSRMSHEMRTPLNGILGMTTLLGDSLSDPEQRRQVETVRNSGEHLLTLINDLLDFARIDAGGLHLELGPVDLEHSVDDAVAVVSPLAQAKGLDLRVRRQPVPWVVSDPGRVRQVLLNLLGNAVKFTDRGHVEVSLSGEPGDDGRWEVRIEVSDSGIGISPSRLAQVFAPFVQGSSGSHHPTGGTGLGLTIARTLAEHLGGEVEARSRPGHGSVFTLALHGVETADGTSADDTHPARTEEFAERLGEEYPLRVLVAEDSPANQQVVRLMLERLGYAPDVVGDGAEAVLATMRQRYDLVLMDVHMPVLDGLAATREIVRSLPEERRPRVVGLSAAVTADDERLGRAAGMQGYLTKPLRPGPLAAVLRGTLPVEAAPHDAADRASRPGAVPGGPTADAGAGAATRTEVVVDWNQAGLTRDLFGHDYPAALQLWEATTEKGFRALRSAHAAGDVDGVHDAAHSIKGAALSMGATGLARRALEVEETEGLPTSELMGGFAAAFGDAAAALSSAAHE